MADYYAQAKALAAWTAQVRAAWPQLHVEHVDSVGVSEDPQIGDTLQVNAYVALSTLTPGGCLRGGRLWPGRGKRRTWPT